MRHKLILVTSVFILLFAIFSNCDTRDVEEKEKFLTLTAEPDTIPQNNGETGARLTVTLENEDGEPLNDEKIRFSAEFPSGAGNLGFVNPDSIYTDETGTATCWFWPTITTPVEFNVYADITATWQTLSQTVRVLLVPPQNFSDTETTTLSLVATPDTIPQNDGVTGSKITAILKDENGEPLIDETIEFEMNASSDIEGIGFLNPEIEHTDNSGEAFTRFWPTISDPTDSDIYIDVTVTWELLSESIRITVTPPESSDK